MSRWIEKTLPKIAEMKSGCTISKEQLGEGIKYITIQQLYYGNSINVLQAPRVNISPIVASVYTLQEGDIIIGKSSVKRDGIGFPAWYTDSFEPSVYSNFTVRLRSNEEVNQKYLFYFLRGDSARKWVISRSQHSALTNINQSILNQFPIKYPECKEHQKKSPPSSPPSTQPSKKTQDLIDKYQKIKTDLMNDLFTRGIGADGKLRPPRSEAPELYKQTELGWIPKEWTIRTVDELFHVQLEKMLSRAAKTGKYELPYLGNKNIQWDYVDFSNLEKMDFQPEERLKFKLEKDDLLTCEGGDVGRTAILRNEILGCFYQKAVHRLRSKENELLPSIMLRYMRYAKVNNLFLNFTSQTSIAHLTREKLIKILVPVPKPEEQEKISNRFEGIDSFLNNESDKYIKLQKQKAGLMQALLTGKVEVTVPDEEVANV